MTTTTDTASSAEVEPLPAPSAPRRQVEPRRRRRRIPIGAYICAALLMVLFLFPLLYLLNTALKSQAEFVANPVGLVSDPQWGNFSTAWEKGDFGAYILNSVL